MGVLCVFERHSDSATCVQVLHVNNEKCLTGCILYTIQSMVTSVRSGLRFNLLNGFYPLMREMIVIIRDGSYALQVFLKYGNNGLDYRYGKSRIG